MKQVDTQIIEFITIGDEFAMAGIGVIRSHVLEILDEGPDLGMELLFGGHLGLDVDHTTHGVATVFSRERPINHFNSLRFISCDQSPPRSTTPASFK